MAELGSVQATLGVRVPSSASAVPATIVSSRHSALVRVTHWITTLCFFALLISGAEIVISHPRFYWGETGNVLTTPLFKLPIPASRTSGADRLRVRAAGPERLEPLSPLSSCLDRGIDRLTVCDFRLVYRAFSEKLAPGKADLSWRAFSTAIASHLRFQRPSEAEAWSYNVLQRLSYLFVIFVLFPLVIWTGLAMSPAFVSAFPATVTLLRRPAIRAHASLLRLHGSRALPAGPCRDGLSCRIQEPHARDDHGPRRTRDKRWSAHERSLTPQTDHYPESPPRRAYRAWAWPRTSRKSMG